MRILFIHRKGVFNFEGGEQDQVRNTRCALEKMGVKIDLADTLPENVSQYDLIHFFGLDVCHIDEVQRAGNVPKVLTPIFWDRAQGPLMDDLFEEWPRSGAVTRDKIVYLFRRLSGLQNRRIALTSRGHYFTNLSNYGRFQQVINNFDLFLPNSEAEMQSLRIFYIIDNCRYQVVRNAVNIEYLNNISDFAQKHISSDTPFILCSAGIDRRKNQYCLVKALIDVDVPLVFAGSVRDIRYYQATVRLATRRKATLFMGHLEKADLNSLYHAAKVHALPSFHDTPGIANLEAVAHECVNVSTHIGGLREYLGDYSLYCNPFSVDHIREQITKALDQPANIDGAKLVRSEYTYEKAAEATLTAYRMLLND